MTARLKVEVQPAVKDLNHDLLRQVLIDTFEEYFRKRETQIVVAELCVNILEAVSNPGYSKLCLQLTGSINGLRLEKKVRASRMPARMHAAGGGGLAGHLVGTVVASAAGAAFGTSQHLQDFDQCFRECTAELMITIDSLACREESPASVLWRRILMARWIAAAATLLSLVLPAILLQGMRGFELLLTAAFNAFFVFLLVHVIGLFCMPSSFFHDDPRGQKSLALTGAQNVFAMRVVCVVFAVVLALGMTCSGNIAFYQYWVMITGKEP